MEVNETCCEIFQGLFLNKSRSRLRGQCSHLLALFAVFDVFKKMNCSHCSHNTNRSHCSDNMNCSHKFACSHCSQRTVRMSEQRTRLFEVRLTLSRGDLGTNSLTPDQSNFFTFYFNFNNFYDAFGKGEGFLKNSVDIVRYTVLNMQCWL